MNFGSLGNCPVVEPGSLVNSPGAQGELKMIIFLYYFDIINTFFFLSRDPFEQEGMFSGPT